MNLFSNFITFITLLQTSVCSAQYVDSNLLEDWVLLPSGLHKSIDSAYESPTKKSTLTLRSFKVEEESLLKDQINIWIRDYKSYGFNLQTQKPIKLKNGSKGFYIEAHHKDFNLDFTQFVSVRKGKMATLTCKSSQKNELKKCKQAILNFSWDSKNTL